MKELRIKEVKKLLQLIREHKPGGVTMFPYSYQYTLLLFFDIALILLAKYIKLDILWFWMADNFHKV